MRVPTLSEFVRGVLQADEDDLKKGLRCNHIRRMGALEAALIFAGRLPFDTKLPARTYSEHKKWLCFRWLWKRTETYVEFILREAREWIEELDYRAEKH